ncbi:RNA ligase family protein [Streptomyces qinzhouensis]|uniref:AAA family ATPase n=1 Tax=Streptomyces qinzhouensis TaxID=2599401 RepID=A0A5B8JLB8_9ACTN|nr:RNA ligase family protein [Streptomyces qinzhouensis]QDY78520.1 AAA family ATPase [Streptomyces qinzhouensis]
MRTHYPRTPHLPWSPGATQDDVRITGPTALTGREIVVTEKLDGENTTLYPDGLHARSLDSGHHPSRAWVKALQGRVGREIPAGWRVCGENLYARHSLAYDGLDSFFYGFSVWDDRGRCLPWDRTTAFLRGLGIPVPRVLWRGVYDERALRGLRIDTTRREGYVVRTADGFGAADFGSRVAKWVRPRHVRTDRHWMHSAVVPNGRSPAAALWDVRSGASARAADLAGALGLGQETPYPLGDPTAADGLGPLGEERLTAALGLLLHAWPRGLLAGRLAPAVGMRTARRTADLVGLWPRLHRPFPDEERRGGLIRLAYAADPRVLHTVAAALASTAEAREQTAWSALYAEDSGLFETPAPWESWRFDGLPPGAADRCRAEAREAYAKGRITGADDAVAATWRRRDGRFPELVHLVGPSGSGKSTYARTVRADRRISLDALREEAGSRTDQRSNGAVLRRGLDRLDRALADGGTVVWDATSLTRGQRAPVHAVAARRSALITHAVVLVDGAELVRRNGTREHPVPPAVLDSQLRRFTPPYPGEAHRTRYIGAAGTVEDTDDYGSGGRYAHQ